VFTHLHNLLSASWPRPPIAHAVAGGSGSSCELVFDSRAASWLAIASLPAQCTHEDVRFCGRLCSTVIALAKSGRNGIQTHVTRPSQGTVLQTPEWRPCSSGKTQLVYIQHRSGITISAHLLGLCGRNSPTTISGFDATVQCHSSMCRESVTIVMYSHYYVLYLPGPHKNCCLGGRLKTSLQPRFIGLRSTTSPPKYTIHTVHRLSLRQHGIVHRSRHVVQAALSSTSAPMSGCQSWLAVWCGAQVSTVWLYNRPGLGHGHCSGCSLSSSSRSVHRCLECEVILRSFPSFSCRI
jgi:hypothetical protein